MHQSTTMLPSEAEVAILKVMTAQPSLNVFGFFPPSNPDFEKDREAMKEDWFVRQFLAAVTWLEMHKKLKRATINSHNSYWLKHAAERWAHDYVSNGALITAAFHLGFPIKRLENPNVLIGLKLK